MTGTISIEISPAELIDKLTILEIRLDRINDPGKRANVLVEHSLIASAYASSIAPVERLTALKERLRRANEKLWEIEDNIRECERRGDFGPTFVELARSVYKTNDQRSFLKGEINRLLGSRLMEEKSYQAY
jgi:hypothetical protein